MTHATEVLVMDGATQWVADRAELMAALKAAGWDAEAASGGLVMLTEPEGVDDEGGAYADLCQDVQPVEGGRPDDGPHSDDGRLVMAHRPDLGRRVWMIASP